MTAGEPLLPGDSGLFQQPDVMSVIFFSKFADNAEGDDVEEKRYDEEDKPKGANAASVLGLSNS